MSQNFRIITDEKYGSPEEDEEGGCHCGVDCNRCGGDKCPLDDLGVGTQVVVSYWNPRVSVGTRGEITDIHGDNERVFSVQLVDGSVLEFSERDMLSMKEYNG